MEMRKVQVTGGSTYIISLPKRWAREVGIKPNDTMGIIPQGDGTLVLSPSAFEDEDPKRKIFEVGDDPDNEELFRDLIAAYVTGHDIIEIYQRPRMSTDVRKVVRRFTQSAIGPEIIDEGIDSIKTRDLLDPSDLPFKTSILRMYRIVSSMHRGAAIACSEVDTHLADDIIFRDNEVDRLHWLVARQYNLLIHNIELVEKIGTPRELAINYLLISRILERIGDHSARMAHQVRDLKAAGSSTSALKTISEISESVLDILDSVITSLLEKDSVLAHECIRKADDVLKELAKFDSKVAGMKRDVALPLGTIVDSLERTGHYTKDIGECVVNYVIDARSAGD